MNYADLFAKLSQVLKGRIPYILIGGFAVNAYKFSRQTADIDLMIIDTDFEKAKAALSTIDYSPFDCSASFARFQDKNSKQIGIDLILVDQNTMDAIAKEAKTMSVAKIEFLIPSLDHLIALKLHALKNNFKYRAGKDLRDILELIQINKLDIGSDSFKNLCLQYGTPDLYKKILEMSL